MSDASQSPPQHDSKPNPTTDVKPDDNCPEPGDSSTLHGFGPPVGESQARVSRNGNPDDAAIASPEEFRVRVCSDGDDGSTSNTSTVDRRRDVERFPGSDSKSLLLEFDEYVATDRSSSGVQRDLGYGFEVGDMVWGKVKSHPWWPGHIYNEAFATSSVRRTKREGHVLVAFFGDSSYGWFEPAELIPFDENFAEKSQQLHSRTFLKAVEEAVDEASRRRGLGLTCMCRNSDNFRFADVKGYFSVDVLDYEPGGFYSDSQIRKARDSFVPSETLDFVRQLALAPHDGEYGSIGFVKNKATVSAYRKAVFEQYDETYAQAFGVQPSRPSRPQNLLQNQPARQPSRGIYRSSTSSCSSGLCMLDKKLLMSKLECLKLQKVFPLYD